MHATLVDPRPKNDRLTPVLAAAATAWIHSGAWAHGQEVKVGVQLPYTGVGAKNAQRIGECLELYLELNLEKVKPHTSTP